MKKIYFLIITIVVIIIILIISILLFLNKTIVDEQNMEINTEFDDYQYLVENPGKVIEGQKPEKEKIYSIYASVEACIEKTFNYVSQNNTEAIYNILNKKYIEDNKITKENIYDMTGLKKIEKYKVQEIYDLTGTNYSSYYVKGVTNNNQNIYLNVNWDIGNSAFDIRILTKEEYEKYISTTIENASSKEESIKSNTSNAIPYQTIIVDEDIAKKYFFDYIERAIEVPEDAYNHLEADYKKSKFNNIDEFKTYLGKRTEISNIYEAINAKQEDYQNYEKYYTATKDIGLASYSIDKKSDYTQYTCIDNYGNYYIFKSTGVMEYTVILDTYTIDIPEFVEQYNAVEVQEKIVLNINKFLLALNEKDYKYLYSILADSFKQTNFKTFESFQNYMKTNFFEKNKFEYLEFGNEGRTYYTYKVKITDSDGKSSKVVEKTFIILLEEGTKFKISFNLS